MSATKGLFLLGQLGFLITLLWSQPTTKLKPAILKAFDQYTVNLEKTYESARQKAGSAFWVERMPSAQRQEIRRGKIVIEKVEDVPEVKGGIIHDWSGAAFIPGTTGLKVLSLLTDYERHQKIYPEAIESKTLEKGEDYVIGRHLLLKKKVLTVVLNTEHKASIAKVAANKWCVISKSIKIAEVRDYGTPGEKELPVGEDSGFLWRLNAYWGVLEEEGGVMVECRSVSLSRDIPWGLGWMIRPFVETMPRETLEATLQATRLALVTVR